MKSNDINNITSAQLRAARALLRINAAELANISKVGVATIRRAEAKDGPLTITEANKAALISALQAAGVEFIPANGGGAGVRLQEK
ncbi:transcriptional regulator [Pseudovibrio denitrificans]|uniref:transcriptional regulator n=1 Tax=Pseudovibrio denitrificans TaxID=258256 RepID=UPI0039BF2E21